MGEAKLDEAKLDAQKEEEEEKCSPPPPILLSVDLHCVGCAKKIEKSILKVRGVVEVEVDMVQNQVKVRGTVEPQVLCSSVQKKTLRRTTIISPPAPSQGDSETEKVAPQVSEMATIELLVNMHCVACAQQLRKKILKLRGVEMAEANLSAGKITVTGTMRGESLVEYIHRCTGKIATIVPQALNEEKEEKKKEVENAEEKPEEENEEKKEDSATAKQEEQEAAPEENREEDNGKGDGHETKQESEDQKKEEEEEKEEGKDKDDSNANDISEQEMMKGTMYNWNGGHSCEEEMNRRMIQWMPVYYAIQQPPPPQIFSDENPNACCIS